MECVNNSCQNVFIHKTKEELTSAFTELWVKVINESERSKSGSFENLQTRNSNI